MKLNLHRLLWECYLELAVLVVENYENLMLDLLKLIFVLTLLILMINLLVTEIS